MELESQGAPRHDPVSTIERALMTMRRDQQARRLQRGLGPRGHAPHDRSLGGAARFRMLDALEDGARTVSDIAGSVGVDQPRASRLVAEAADRGLVRRNVDPADARRAVVELTPAGRTFLRSAHQTRRSAVETALGGFSAEESAQLALLLERFVAAWPRDQNDSSAG
ncbi:MAG: MarR family winged helix-turn-helix transcriptional regulator [Pseudolysinimonas sp.]